MIMRISLCIVLTVITINNGYTDESWPSNISYYFVSKYVQQGENLNTDNLQAEYNYVLTFLERAIAAYKANIVNFFTEDSLIKYEPVLENGKLVIKEVADTCFVVTKYGVREKVNILVLVEYLIFSDCLLTYNQLVDFWYERTGLMIRERLSSTIEEEVWAFIMSNDTGIEVRELTPEEFDQVEAIKRELGWIQ
jgi:hypothetical protein